MKNINAIVSVLATASALTACATTGRSIPVEGPASSGSPKLDFTAAQSSDSELQAWFPGLVSEAALPTVASVDKALSTERDRFALTARVCVAPDGTVRSVSITQPSGSRELDAAATADIAGWHFESFRAPARVQVCKLVDIAYEPHAEKSHLGIPLVRVSR